MKTYPINELASIVAMANEAEQLALTNDIAKNGQKDPIVLWKGEIVDGRCRQLACISLDLELKTRELDSSLTQDEVAAVVKSLNTRRNLTITQKVVSAYKQQVRTGETNPDIVKQWAISLGSLKNCKYIALHKPDYIEPLFCGKSIKIFNSAQGKEITTNRVNTIAKILRDNKDLVSKTVDTKFEHHVKYSVDELPLSSIMYEWYGTKLAEYKQLTPEGKEMMLKALLFELAEYKEVAKE